MGNYLKDRGCPDFSERKKVVRDQGHVPFQPHVLHSSGQCNTRVEPGKLRQYLQQGAWLWVFPELRSYALDSRFNVMLKPG